MRRRELQRRAHRAIRLGERRTRVIVDIDGDRATSSCRLRAYHCGTGEDAHLFYECFARYEDELLRTADGWRITRRRMRVEIELGTRAVLKPLPT